MSPQAQDHSDSASVYFVALIVVLFVLVLCIPLYIDYLLVVWRYVRLGELWLLSWIPDWVPFFGSLPIDDAYQCLAKVELCLAGQGLDTQTAKQIDKMTIAYFSWIPGLFFIYKGIKLHRNRRRISNYHDTESLLKQNAFRYASSARFVNADPVNSPFEWDRTDPDSAEFGASLSPEVFATMAPPLGLVKAARKDDTLKRAIWDGDLDFDFALAEQAFIVQLGPTFTGVDNLSPLSKKVFEQMVKKLTFSPKKTKPLVMRALSKSAVITAPGEVELATAIRKLYKSGNLPTNRRKLVLFLCAEESLATLYSHAIAEAVMMKHGYVTTGLMSLLEEVRTGGVLASCEFLWVKNRSRPLWYVLSTTGRRESFAEAGGPYAQWLVEKHLDRPLSFPVVGESVVALEKALKLDIRRANAEAGDYE